MEVLHDPCCGLDVHRKTVIACLKTGSKKEVRTFGTTTPRLRDLSTWLLNGSCAYVAMESTGVYWKPIYNVLEQAGVPATVVNARHIKAVPGRKTDVKDAEWICDLARHGLVRASFIPDRPQRELQELIRYRRGLINERTREVNRVHKVLEGANIKLATVVEDLLGVSARAMIEAIANGKTDPDEITSEIRTRLKAPLCEIREAVAGTVGDHQRLLLTAQLSRIDAVNERVALLSAEIDGRLEGHERLIERLDEIPGVGRITAQELLAALGTDMSQFPNEAHLASWAKLCPGANQSAGKRKPVGTGHGNPYLRSTLVEAARAAVRKRNTYLRDKYYRLLARKGSNRALVAVAHTILVIAYHIIKDESADYHDLGIGYLRKQDKEALTRQLVRRLQKLGHKVTLESAA